MFITKGIGCSASSDCSRRKKRIENCIYLINQLCDLGFTRCRMFSQKKRHEYKKGNTTVCFDLFPSHVGAFIELEACSEEKLIALKGINGFT